MLLALMLSCLVGTFADPSVPYGVRSKCYKVFSKVTQGLATSAFCKIGPLSEVHVCAMNIDDANFRVRTMESEIRALNSAVCNKQSQDFCKSLGFTLGACPAAPYRCKMPFKNECEEDADCKVPVNVCCATCEEEAAALKCEGFTEKLKDAYCQVAFVSTFWFVDFPSEYILQKILKCRVLKPCAGAGNLLPEMFFLILAMTFVWASK